jgi:hypothetical protein
MKSAFLDLLKQVADGVTIYKPFRRDTQGMAEFQDTVHRLREMERLGLIGRLFVQMRQSRDAEVVELVMVQGLRHEVTCVFVMTDEVKYITQCSTIGILPRHAFGVIRWYEALGTM